MSYQIPGTSLNCDYAPCVVLDFGGDLSANRRTQWLRLGRGQKHLSLHLVIPAGVTGAFALECSNVPTVASGEAHPATATSAWVAAQPANSGASLFPDNILTTAVYVAVAWTWSAGGTGIVPTVAVMGV
jgi:hypothetical protein